MSFRLVSVDLRGGFGQRFGAGLECDPIGGGRDWDAIALEIHRNVGPMGGLNAPWRTATHRAFFAGFHADGGDFLGTIFNAKVDVVVGHKVYVVAGLVHAPWHKNFAAVLTA